MNDIDSNWVEPPHGVKLFDEDTYLASEQMVINEIPTQPKIDFNRNGVFTEPPEGYCAVSQTVRTSKCVYQDVSLTIYSIELLVTILSQIPLYNIRHLDFHILRHGVIVA